MPKNKIREIKETGSKKKILKKDFPEKLQKDITPVKKILQKPKALSEIIEAILSLENPKKEKEESKDSIEKTLKKEIVEDAPETKSNDNKPQKQLYSRKSNLNQYLQQEYVSKLDYASLFSYFGSGKVSYFNTTETAEHLTKAASTTNVLDSERIDSIMKKKILSYMLGGVPYYIGFDEEERYRMWKKLNKNEWWWKFKNVNNMFGTKDIDYENPIYALP
jgi:hypothetical protein